MVDRDADVDPQETREWLEALGSVLSHEGPARAHYLIERLVDQARRSGVNLPYSANTAYVNTIHASQEPPMPGALYASMRSCQCIAKFIGGARFLLRIH